jgi:hypothetical protein
VAVDDAANTAEDVPVTINALTNDSDVDGDTLTITSVTATNGTAAIVGGTNVLFTPSANFNGTATIGYSISDGNAGTASALITVTVSAVNHSPVAAADALTRYANSSAKISVALLLANDSDSDLDTITITGVTSPTANGATVTRDGDWVIYEPVPGFNGADSFEYTISDGRGGTDIGTVTVNLAPASDNQTQNLISITSSGADAIVRFAGIAGRAYRIETTADLTRPITWTPHPVGPLVAGFDGIIQLTDPAPPSPRFYRAVEF